MPSTYERRLILSYLSNAFSRLRSRDEEGRKLLRWLREHADRLEIPYPLASGKDAERAVGKRFPDGEVATVEWPRVGRALRDALVAARQARPNRTTRRLRRLAKATRLSRTDIAILELMLRYNTASLVESLIDDLKQTMDWGRGCLKLGNPVLPCLLGLSAGAVYGRFAPDAPLVTSGLVSIDDDGEVTLVDRLTRLHWLPKEAGSDVQHLLLDKAGAGELRWSDFDHVAGDRDHLERLLKGALRSGQKGVNVLVHGPAGTGKTEFCKTLAARLRAPLYLVGESDAKGGEPCRHERMQELRLAQRLLAGDRRSILLFDEMEDLLSTPGRDAGGILRVRSFPSALGRRLEGVHEPTPGRNSGAGSVDVERRPVHQSCSVAPHDVCPGTASTPTQGRARIWARQLAQNGIESAEEDAHALAREFDYRLGYRFSIFAGRCIRQSITRGISYSVPTIRIPVNMIETRNKLIRAHRSLCRKLGREPRPKEVAMEMGVTADDLLHGLIRIVKERMSRRQK